MEMLETQSKAYICMRLSAEIRAYNPQKKKLDSRTMSGYFIAFAENSKGCRFYCPSRATRIVEY